MKRFIYLISPNKVYKGFYKDLNAVLASKKVYFFQIRLKNLSNSKLIKVSKKIRIITKKYNVKLIINDFPIITKKLKADGCHLGQKDGSVKGARKILKNKIIGRTCHGSKNLILKAIEEKPDYIAIGSFYKSKLKPKAKFAKKSLIKWTKKTTNLPIVAIGGIDNKNYKSLIRFGVNYLAISSYIWNNPRLKPKKAILKFI